MADVGNLAGASATHIPGRAVAKREVVGPVMNPYAEAFANFTSDVYANTMAERASERKREWQLEDRAYQEGVLDEKWERGEEDRELSRKYTQAQIDQMKNKKTTKLSVAGKAKLDKLKGEMEYAMDEFGPGSPQYKAASGNIDRFLNTIDGGETPRPAADIQAEMDALAEGAVSDTEFSGKYDSDIKPKPKKDGVLSAGDIVDAEGMVNPKTKEDVTTKAEAEAAIEEHRKYTRRGIKEAYHTREIMKLRNNFGL